MDKTIKEPNKPISIIVNGREHTVLKEDITFEEVITLALGTYDPNPNIAYTVTYSWGGSGKEKGTMTHGSSVCVKKGMVLNVTRTDRS